VLKEKVDFFETHPTFVIGMNEGKDQIGSGEGVGL
jgi:hypothetical protein